MKLPASLLKRATAPGKSSPVKVKVPRGMNGLERAYAQYLEARVRTGSVEWFAYQPWRLRIAHGSRQRFYTPDFVVKFPGGYTEFHETKGHMREAAALRLDVAATAYPYSFVVVRRDSSGGLGGWSWQTIVKGGVTNG